MISENVQAAKKIFRTMFRRHGLFNLTLVGKQYKVCYEAAHYREERDYPIIKSLAKGKKCILDVGANVGTSTLLLAEDNEAIIYAMEASEYACKIIINNCQANGIAERVQIINTLVSESAGLVIPFYWDFSSGGASIYRGRMGHNFIINKSTIALDDFVLQHHLEPDLIKLDVEGAEESVLKGAEVLLRDKRPLVFLELHSIGEAPLWKNAENILNYMIKLNYKMVYLKTKEKIVDALALKDRGRCHVLLLPEEINEKEILNSLDTNGL